MAEYTKLNLKDEIDDQAPNFGLSPDLELRMARDPLGMENAGISYQRLAPNFRVPFGHRHKQQEETYVVVGGSGRVKLEDEVVELERWDAIRVHRGTMRCFEGGPDGIEIIAVGAPNTGPGDGDIHQGWWSD